MRLSALYIAMTFCFTLTLQSGEPVTFDTQWLSSKPEVMTYHATSPQGDGLNAFLLR